MSPLKISKECVVGIHYTLTGDGGEQIDASGDEPMLYLHGRGNLISGLEQELDGKQAGESLSAVIEPALGYGEVDMSLFQDVPRELLAQIDNLQVGMMLQSRSEDGQVMQLVVDEIGDETIRVNANHPLAGKTLHFEVTIDSVREATQEELDHGHAH